MTIGKLRACDEDNVLVDYIFLVALQQRITPIKLRRLGYHSPICKPLFRVENSPNLRPAISLMTPTGK